MDDRLCYTYFLQIIVGPPSMTKDPWVTINPKRIMQGLCRPRKTSTDDPAAIIGTQEPMFHLIIHNISSLCHAA